MEHELIPRRLTRRGFALFSAASLLVWSGASCGQLDRSARGSGNLSADRKHNTVAPPYAFKRDDHVLVLVTGEPLQSTLAGYSGKGSLYVATGTTPAGRLAFSGVPGAQNVSLERRSGADVTNKGEYGKSAYIPPGIYFLHYHRFDPSHGGRPRLGLSDARCDERINARSGGAPVTRSGVQFHIAYNNLAEMEPDVSEGCVTLRRAEFGTLFPTPFFGAESPLPACGGHTTPTAYGGAGKILVFVTDASDLAIHQRQVAMFQALLTGSSSAGVTPSVFVSGSAELRGLRDRWYVGIP